MANVEIYTTQTCPFCHMARRLLSRKGADYSDYDVGTDAGLRQKMTVRAGGRRTVPQIFIDDAHIGGFDDLAALERAGKLDALLSAPVA